MTHSVASADFRLSRIYAQGWNAARSLSTRVGVEKVINPYKSEPERDRWDKGYANALRSNRQIRFSLSRVFVPPAK